MIRYGLRRTVSLRSTGLALAGILFGGAGAHPSHSTPPPPPPGHGKVLVRLIWPRGGEGAIPNGPVKLEAVELRRAAATPGERWESLPPLRLEFSARELDGGQVWVADAALKAGEFDAVRMGAGGGSQIPIALRVSPGQWIIVTLEVGLQPAGAGAPLRLELKRARTMGPS